MLHFAEVLSRQLGRPVVDMTGLLGVFDFTLEYAPDDVGSANDSASSPSIFAASSSLGSSCNRKRGPIEILVIDAAEKIPLKTNVLP